MLSSSVAFKMSALIRVHSCSSALDAILFLFGRLAMVLADAPSLREVKLFPHMRPESGTPGDGAANDED